MSGLACIILAAGEGKRFKSATPKPLHRVCGRAMIDHVLTTVRRLGADPVVIVIGAGRDQMRAHLADSDVLIAVQERQLGTGDAAASAREPLAGHAGPVLVTCADAPLVREQTLRALLDEHRRLGAIATVLTAIYDDPTGYGRVVRDEHGLVRAIVEHRDADPAVLSIREINSSIYIIEAGPLFEALGALTADNDQGEYYLPDVIGAFVAQGKTVGAVVTQDPMETMGINDRAQLAQAEAIARDRIRRRLMIEGVTLLHPESIFVDEGVRIGRDTVIWPGAAILGETTVGEGCVIRERALIENSRLGDACLVDTCSIIRDSVAGDRVSIGPFSHVRANSSIGDDSRVGSYSEVVRTTIGRRCKDLHFGYLGDTVMGDDINIGAGTVTCNYDGRNKNRTVIGNGAFIGSNSTLVPPVEVGDRAYIAAGSVINRNVPGDALGIGRARQENKEGYAQRLRGGG